MGKIIAVAAVCVLCGFLAGRLSRPEPRKSESSDNATATPVETDRCEKFQKMYDRLRADYIQLQNETREIAGADRTCASETTAATREPAPDLSENKAGDLLDVANDATAQSGNEAPPNKAG